MSTAIVHALPSGESNNPPVAPPPPLKKRRAVPTLAWFAGAKQDLLNQCPSEKPFYNAVGLAVLLTAIMSGVALTVALGYVLDEPPQRLWPVGLAWFVIIGNIDRLLQMVTASKRMFLAMLPRLLLSVVIAITIAEPLTLRIFQPEISQELQHTQQLAIQSSTTGITNFYTGKITADQNEVASLQNQEQTLQTQINQNNFVAACEAGEVTCSMTHELGCGPVCQHYQQLAATAQQQLNAITPTDNSQISTMESQIGTLEAKEKADTSNAGNAIKGDGGLIAREDALSEVMRVHPGVAAEVWFIRAGLLLLDLLPLLVKYLFIVFSAAAYEKLHAAKQRREASQAHGVDVETRVEVARIDDQGESDEEVNRVTIQADRDRRIGDIEGEWYGATGSPSSGGGTRIKAMSLSDYVGKIQDHESKPVPVPPGLRMAGWIGTSLIAAMAVTLGVITYYTRTVVGGEWLAFGALLMAVSLMAFTKGFREAPAWALRATLAALLAGLGLPVLVLALNL